MSDTVYELPSGREVTRSEIENDVEAGMDSVLEPDEEEIEDKAEVYCETASSYTAGELPDEGFELEVRLGILEEVEEYVDVSDVDAYREEVASIYEESGVEPLLERDDFRQGVEEILREDKERRGLSFTRVGRTIQEALQAQGYTEEDARYALQQLDLPVPDGDSAQQVFGALKEIGEDLKEDLREAADDAHDHLKELGERATRDHEDE